MGTFVSIIVPNLNGYRFLKVCFESLRNQTFKHFEIIMVDNGSTDNSVSFVKKYFPEVKIISNLKNAGFAVANNQGYKIAAGKYIATLNNDTMADREWLENLILTAEGNDTVGMCASKVLSMDNPPLIDSVGLNICLDGMARGRGRSEIDNGQYDSLREAFFPSACAALYRKKMLDDIGFFDATFFAYCEDSDLGVRGRLAGWKTVLVPDAVVYHHYSETGGEYSSFKAYLVERNHAWLVIKAFPFELVVLFPFFTCYRLILQLYAVLTKKGAISEFLNQASFLDSVKIVIKGYLEVLRKTPEFIKKRRIIQKSKKISRKELYSLLHKHKLTFRELVFKK
jgi:GT2 family glycosyltransferase